ALLQETQARAANGDLSARATISSGELAPLAHSLNLMLERMARSRGAEETLGGIEHSIAQLERATYALSQGQLQQPISPQELGRLTPVALHLEQLRAAFCKSCATAAASPSRWRPPASSCWRPANSSSGIGSSRLNVSFSGW